MTLQEYYNKLTYFINNHPQALDFKVVYAKDDEGNEYKPVYYEPSIGFFDGDYIGANSFEEHGIDPNHANCVCIN